jgi:Tfp pilus assembly protein PilF
MRHAIRSLFALALVVCAGTGLSAQTTHPEAESRFNNGISHLRAGQLNLAIEEFQAAIKDDPKNPYFYKGLGLALARQGKNKEAVDAFRKALEINPYYVDVRNDLGASLILSGKREEGKKEFKTAYEDPTNPTPETAARNLGQAYQEEKNYPDAMSWFESSILKNKSYPDGYLGLSDVLTTTGHGDQAIQKLEAGLLNCPEDIEISLALGIAYYRAGRFTEARARLERVAQKDPAGESGRRAVDLLKNFPK